MMRAIVKKRSKTLRLRKFNEKGEFPWKSISPEME